MLDSAQFISSQTIYIDDIQDFLVNDAVDFSIPGVPGTLTANQKREENRC